MSASSPQSPSKAQHKESPREVQKEAEEAPQPSEDAPAASSSATANADPEDDSDDLDLPEAGDVPKSPTGVIEMETFQQIREMDEDEDEDADEDSDPREFSRSIVWGFFDQAEKTFGEMQQALRARDLDRLSSLGHFLKGSSAALGIINVQAICEKIQHYGHKHDEDQQKIEEEDALKRIASLLKDCKKDYVVAKAWLVNLYESGE